MKSCVRMKNTIPIVCGAQKDGDDTLLVASVYVRLQKPGFFYLFIFFLLERKHRPLPFFFLILIWKLQRTAQVSFVAEALPVITAGAIVFRLKSSHSSAGTKMTEQKDIRACLGRSQAIDRNVHIIRLVNTGSSVTVQASQPTCSQRSHRRSPR